jgi:hypothetical protein
MGWMSSSSSNDVLVDVSAVVVIDEYAIVVFADASKIDELVVVVVASIGAAGEAILGIDVKAGLAAPAGHQRDARGQSAPAGQNR